MKTVSANPLMPGLLATLSMRSLKRRLSLAQKMGINMLHTARPVSFYQTVFYEGASKTQLVSLLQGKRLIDVACGYTPYTKDSLFRLCIEQGIDVYGIDPIYSSEPNFSLADQCLAFALGSRSKLRSSNAARDRMISAYAQNLPFSDTSVDELLCAYLLFVWMHDESSLLEVFTEFARVLKPGGVAKIYPVAAWRSLPLSDATKQKITALFDIQERFVSKPLSTQIIPAMTLSLTKRDQ